VLVTFMLLNAKSGPCSERTAQQPLSDNPRANVKAPLARGFGPPRVSEPPDRPRGTGRRARQRRFVTWMRLKSAEMLLSSP